MQHDSSFRLDDPASDPVFFVPMVDLTSLKAPNIIDDF
jgi:hypothetical protein